MRREDRAGYSSPKHCCLHDSGVAQPPRNHEIAAALVSGQATQGQPGGLDIRRLARRHGPGERLRGRVIRAQDDCRGAEHQLGVLEVRDH